MPNPLVHFLQSFQVISEEDKALLDEISVLRHYKDGDVLFQQGHTAREMFFICQGILKIVNCNDKGNDVTYFFIRENQFCTILNSFNNQVPAYQNIVAACDATVIALHREKLLTIYKKAPHLQVLITQISQQALLNKIDIQNAYHSTDAATRYKTFLERQPEVALRVSMTDVASYLGITPQSLSRIRRNIR